MSHRAIFLDRDGVINELVDRGEAFMVRGRPVRWTAPFRYEEFFLKDAIEAALERIAAMGFLRVLVTNQPDMYYGLMEEAEFRRIMERVRLLPLDDVRVCLHGQEQGCVCKKPKPGMILEAARQLDIELASSYMIGDSSVDMQAGRAAGCRTIQIDRETPTLAHALDRIQHEALTL